MNHCTFEPRSRLERNMDQVLQLDSTTARFESWQGFPQCGIPLHLLTRNGIHCMWALALRPCLRSAPSETYPYLEKDTNPFFAREL